MRSILDLELWRRYGGPAPTTLSLPGQAPIEVRPGDYILAWHYRHLPNDAVSHLGAALEPKEVSARLGYAPEPRQALARPLRPEPPKKRKAVMSNRHNGAEPWPGRAIDSPFGGGPMDAPQQQLEISAYTDGPLVEIQLGPDDTAADLLEGGRLHHLLGPILDEGNVGAALIIEHGVVVGEGLGDRLLAAREANGAGAVVPLCNVSAPTDLPAPGDATSPHPRIRGGLPPAEIDAALRGSALPPIPGCPRHPGVLLLCGPLVAQMAEGKRPCIRSTTVVCQSAFVWRAHDRPGPISELVDTDGGASSCWGIETSAARAAVAYHRPQGLPVALYTSNVGPWGGVLLLLELADRLHKHGVWAQVVGHSLTPHQFRPQVPPVMVRHPSQLKTDWRRHLGWSEGIVVASHWGAGKVAREIVDSNPDLQLTTVLQDREDWFEGNGRRGMTEEMIRGFIDIGRGIGVSRWILDTAAEDLGLQREKYSVIPAGVDTALFHPRGPRDNRRVRVLAMWRPKTAVRRGMARLRQVYEGLHRRFGDRISLELFGWTGHEANVPSCVGACGRHGRLGRRDLAELMAQVDIVVEPSEYQGFGLTGLEAMASGATLVSTQCRGVDEYATHDQDALVVPHDDLEEAVAQAIADAAMRRRLAGEAVERARGLDWGVIASRWAEYLKGLKT
ncbi:MAG: glycosyltransferase family 4 protein [Bradymonadia bacterium]